MVQPLHTDPTPLHPAEVVDPFAPTVEMDSVQYPRLAEPTPAPCLPPPRREPPVSDTGPLSRRATADELTPDSPYDLSAGGADSSEYYRTVSSLADEVLVVGLGGLQPTLEGFFAHRRKQPPRAPKASREALVELLTLGVLYRAYAARMAQMPAWARGLLGVLAWIRPRVSWLRRPVDALRGGLLTRYATGAHRENAPPASRDGLRQLVAWLTCTGEYPLEARRLHPWTAWLDTLPEDHARDRIAEILDVSDWFEAAAAARLAPYTWAVRRWSTAHRREHHGLEDILLVSRDRPEVHLNLVGAEILNRVFQRRFAETERRLVLLPGCLRSNVDGDCRATATDEGLRCTGCAAHCRVRTIARLGDEAGFEVRVLTHASQLRTGRRLAARAHRGLGVVGVACAGHLLAGGWLTREAGLPAQCVVLDRCTCRRHWHPDGPPTDLNLAELLRRVGRTPA